MAALILLNLVSFAFGAERATNDVFVKRLARGVKATSVGAYAAARRDLAMAAALEPRRADPHYRLGELAARTHDEKRAVYEFKTCLHLDAKHVQCRAQLAKLDHARKARQ